MTPACDAGPARLSPAATVTVPIRELNAEQETHLASWTRGT